MQHRSSDACSRLCWLVGPALGDKTALTSGGRVAAETSGPLAMAQSLAHEDRHLGGPSSAVVRDSDCDLFHDYTHGHQHATYAHVRTQPFPYPGALPKDAEHSITQTMSHSLPARVIFLK